MAVLVVSDAVKQPVAPYWGGSICAVEGVAHPYRLLIESMQEGIAIVRRDGLVNWCNPHLAVLLTRRVENGIGATVDAVGASR